MSQNSSESRVDQAAVAVMASPAGTTAALAGLVVLVASAIGVEMPEQAAVTFVAIAVIVVSALSPRWATERGLLPYAHPAGFTAGLAATLVWVAALLGAEISSTDATLVVSALVAIVGFATPIEDEPLDPPLQGKRRL